ncbi:response regulator transcription factor [Salipaludibacillus sp. CF4.18]|uniref:response regulator transcription factor n=1 Tax=Salipaludibacillus sp. CF4.18 TaxID=3373081 RepID=UPI003EE525F6
MNIFIVEDEYWSLLELEGLLKKYEPKHKIYPFANGEDLINMLEEVTPQLVISDITMPGMSGLELIEQIKTFDESIKCVILSVHDQFEYARQGIKLGVIEYLIKPVKREALYDVVDRSISIIEEEHKEIEEKRHWSVNKMLQSEKELDEMNVFNQDDYYIIYMLAENWKATRGWSSSRGTDEDFKQILSDTYLTNEQIYCINIDNQRKLLLVAATDENQQSLFEAKVNDLYKFINQDIHVHLSFMRKKCDESLMSIVHILEQRIENHMNYGQPSFIKGEETERNIDLAGEWMNIRVIETAIRNGEIIKAKEYVQHIVQSLKEKQITLRQLSLFLRNMYYALIFKLEQQKGSDVQIETVKKNFDYLQEVSTFNELYHSLEQMIDQLVEEDLIHEVAPKNLIPRVLHWIHQQYQTNLKFQTFAEENHVSLSYLSREFKAQTGKTFSEYLMIYRINKAKEYFNKGITRTAEVSKLVGYEDDKYFTTVFKRMEGLTPAEYKKRL